MVQFIRKEAEEKANEIRAAAQEEYTIQKQTMVEAEKAKIRKEYERKRSQIDTKKAMYVLFRIHLCVFSLPPSLPTYKKKQATVAKTNPVCFLSLSSPKTRTTERVPPS